MKKSGKLLIAGGMGVALLAVCAWRSPAFRRMISPQAVAAYAPAQSYVGALAPQDQSLWQQGTGLVARLAREAAAGELLDGQGVQPGDGVRELPRQAGSKETGPLNGPAVVAPHHHQILQQGPGAAAEPPAPDNKPQPKEKSGAATPGEEKNLPSPQAPDETPAPSGDVPGTLPEKPGAATPDNTPKAPSAPAAPACGPQMPHHQEHHHH